MTTPMATDLAPEALRAARAGAGWGFEQAFEALAPEVHGYLRAQRAADPEASTNEAFLEVHRRLAGFDGDEGSFRAWVFVVAHQVLLHERARLGDDDAVGAAPVEPVEPGGDVEMLEALDALTAEQRDVLLLRYVANLTLDQVAEATGRRVSAVKALQRRALDGLRRRLTAEPGGEDEIPAGAVSQDPPPSLTGA